MTKPLKVGGGGGGRVVMSETLAISRLEVKLQFHYKKFSTVKWNYQFLQGEE
jgi:hypothetical protein